MHIIDRRLNPKSKSLGNRQRFIRRAKEEIRNAVNKALRKRKISEIEASEKIRVRSKSLSEPSFGLSGETGARDFVLPGNHEYVPGDKIPKPPQGGGRGGKEGATDGDGEDDFVFTLSREEFLDIFFDDLKLPNLIKAKLKDVRSPKPTRAGYTTDGPPSKLNRVRTVRNSFARRIALRRPKLEAIRTAEEELAAAESATPRDDARIQLLRERVARLKRLRSAIAFVDPFDLQYNRFERVPKPTTQAVMFCLMDTSASMSESLKDLAKRFFMLLYVFLSRHYQNVQIVFIRHTSVAAEVDENTFFHSTETGGTIISTAFEEILRVVKDRYPPSDWNIYAAQASDGDNASIDMNRCIEMLDEEVVPLCQYFAYIEVGASAGRSIVWDAYEELVERHPHFAMRGVTSVDEIYPVFRDLFSAERT
ncbi:MAG: YeaH/YhbH family protein [Hyphomicrobiales bacterium]|nr:YeaH/YhbH family protein [Hyphomicrobiales bacterium]